MLKITYKWITKMLAHKKREKMNFERGLLLLFLIISSMIAIPFQYSEAGAGNSAPELESIGDQREDEDDTSRIEFSATDPNGDDILTFTSSTLPPFAVLIDNGDRTARLEMATSFNDEGTYQITITVTDNGSPNLSDSETFDLVITDDGDPTGEEESIQDTVTLVIEMIEDDKLNEGQAVSLIQKLDSAIKKLEDGKDNSAYNMLQSFINHIEAFMKSGVLTFDEGQPLIDSARAVQDTLF